MEIFFCQRKQVSQCQLVNIIGSLVTLFTAFPSVYLSLSLFLQIPSILLVKSKGYFRELEFISLPNRGSLFKSKLVVSKYTDNSRTFLFIFPSSEDYRNRCLNVWLGGSSQWTGIQRYLGFRIDKTQWKQIETLHY